MCECHPNADFLSAYEPALFQRYDLAAEFLRRRRLVKDLLAERWPRLHKEADAEIVRELVCVCSIVPLRLDREHERLMVDEVGVVAESAQPCYLYRRFIPFEGDAELWHLSPTPNVDRRAGGEVSTAQEYCLVVWPKAPPQASLAQDGAAASPKLEANADLPHAVPSG